MASVQARHILFGVVLAALLTALPRTARASCQDLIEAKAGDLILSNDTRSEFKLGEGAMAEVVRVIPKVGESYIRKTYKSLHGLEDEALGLAFLTEQIVKSGVSDRIKVVSVLRIDRYEGAILFKDVGGQTLADVFEKKLGSESTREKLAQKYLEVRRELEHHILREFSGRLILNHLHGDEGDLNSIRSMILRNGSDLVAVAIKLDNILVTPDGSLVLIDPS